MSILAEIPNGTDKVTVEILDAYEAGGVKMASVCALEGLPFVGGDRWPVRTAYTVVKADQLQNVHQEPAPQPAKPTLLDLALAAHKPQWYSGESVWIWRDNGSGAYLKNNGGFVSLCLTGHQPSCVIFYLLPNGWQTSKVVKADYRKWATEAQANRSK